MLSIIILIGILFIYHFICGLWPRPWPRPQGIGLDLGLDLKALASVSASRFWPCLTSLARALLLYFISLLVAALPAAALVVSIVAAR